MTDSPQQPRLQIKQDEQQQRLCDFCSESIALLYCRADSAKLCLSCDRQVHSTNQLFTKHTRSLLCDSCGSTPASILCSTETFVLCQNCDWERHSLSSSTLHERRPLEGFTGCPSVNELLAIVGFDDVTKKGLLCEEEDLGGSGFGFSGSENDGYSDYLVWETPSIVTLDDLISSNTSHHSFPAMGVPPLPKNRKAACGQYKEEILSQLREMAKSEPNFSDGLEGDIKPFTQFQSPVPEYDLQPGDMNAGFERGAEAGAFRWCNDTVDLANQGPLSKLLGNYIEDNCFVPDKDSDIGGSASHTDCGHEGQSHHCDVTDTTQVLPKVAARELTSQERDSAILRYKEKKKTRRYQKHIRYESRKIRAESRTRIKGRFAKMDN